MAITYTTPDGTSIAGVANLATWYFAKEGRAAPTNGVMIIDGYRKPGTAIS